VSAVEVMLAFALVALSARLGSRHAAGAPVVAVGLVFLGACGGLGLLGWPVAATGFLLAPPVVWALKRTYAGWRTDRTPRMVGEVGVVAGGLILLQLMAGSVGGWAALHPEGGLPMLDPSAPSRAAVVEATAAPCDPERVVMWGERSSEQRAVALGTDPLASAWLLGRCPEEGERLVLIRHGRLPASGGEVADGAVLYRTTSSDRQRVLYMLMAAVASGSAGLLWLFWFGVTGSLPKGAR
jgi:hypothetical protein